MVHARPMKIGISGLSGRMGHLLVEESTAAGHTVVGGIANTHGAPSGIPVMTAPELAALAETIIDFSHASTAQAHAAAFAAAGTRWILGTTGLSRDDEAAVDAAARQIAVVYAPNFGPGVNLLLA